MELIPVIDIKNNVSVHAVKGHRDNYQPLNTAHIHSSDPFAVIDFYLGLSDFKTLYLADLDAIMLQGNNSDLITSLIKSYPKICFWVDRGGLDDKLAVEFVPVIGSESIQNKDLDRLKHVDRSFILSLDHSTSGRMGPTSLFTDHENWPQKIIVMSLARVGSFTGPDFQELDYYCRQNPAREWIAAGGIRNSEDIYSLERMGIRQALIASALQNGNIDKDDILRLSALRNTK